MSSSFSNPQDIVPSPTPFCPASSSSNKRKFRGTTLLCDVNDDDDLKSRITDGNKKKMNIIIYLPKYDGFIKRKNDEI